MTRKKVHTPFERAWKFIMIQRSINMTKDSTKDQSQPCSNSGSPDTTSKESPNTPKAYILDFDSVEDLLYTTEKTDHFLKLQKAVEIVGIVGETDMKSNLFKFTLINNSGMTIQVLVWDRDVAQKYNNKFVSGNVIHIDGAYVVVKHATLSKSSITHDLIIGTNTIVNVLKTGLPFSPTKDSQKEIPTTTIEHSIEHDELIQIVGYIKQKIAETSLPREQKINAGCITDCVRYKLEVRMPILSDMSEFPVGSHVRITGIVKHSTHPYLWVVKKEDVELESHEKKKIFELVKANTIPKKVCISEATDNHSPCKKPRIINSV